MKQFTITNIITVVQHQVKRCFAAMHPAYAYAPAIVRYRGGGSYES